MGFVCAAASSCPARSGRSNPAQTAIRTPGPASIRPAHPASTTTFQHHQPLGEAVSSTGCAHQHTLKPKPHKDSARGALYKLTRHPEPPVPPRTRPEHQPQAHSGRRARDPQAAAAEPKPATLSAAQPPQPALLERIRVTPVVDQHGFRYVQIVDGAIEVVLPSQVIGNAAGLGEALTQAGIPAYSPATRTGVQRLAERMTAEPELRWIATMPGYYAGAYVMPDGRVVGRCQHRLHVTFSGSGVPLAQAGSLAGWRIVLRRFGRGQTNVVFAACVGLVGSILDLAPFDTNPCWEWAGRTSQGKSTMAQVIASLSGALMGSAGGLALSWQATKAGLEQPFLARQFTTVPVDEATAAGIDVPAQGRVVGDVTLYVAQGISKLRHGSGEPIHLRMALVGTANHSLADAQQRGGAAVEHVNALAARLYTIPIDAGSGLGCWDSVPPGCGGPADAVAQLRARLDLHHGWALERFLECLARERRRDDGALRARIQALRDEFLGRVQIAAGDDLGLRRARQFALVYAAGRLACEWKVLPFRGVGTAILTIFQRAETLRAGAQAATPPTALDRIRRHVEERQADIVDLDVADPPELTRRQLDRAPGFFKRIGDRRYLLLRAATMERLFGIGKRKAIQELRAGGRLLSSDKLQYQYRVRQEAAHDRVYAVTLDG